MFGFIREFLEALRRYDERSSVANEFDGYGFMKRVYGIESMPRFETVAKLARTDTLTQLYNRMAFDELIIKEMATADRYGNPLSVTVFNIDNFRQLNHDHSFMACDQLIKDVAKVMQEQVRTADILFRWYSDEFLLILPHTNLDAAVIACEKSRKVIEAHDFGEIGKITCSFGVLQYRQGDTIDSMLKSLDSSLQRAKKAGKNRIEVIRREQ